MALRKGQKAEAEVEVKEKEEAKEAKEEAKEVEIQEVKVEAKKPSTMPNVRIRPNQDLRTYIGDQWYTLKKGVVTTVPQNVKEILAKAGMLDPL